MYTATAEQEGGPGRIAQPTHSCYLVVHVGQVKRSRTRFRPSQQIMAAPQPEESRATRSSASLPSPWSKEPQQMRPSSISCKPPAEWPARTPVPRDNPMPGGFILLGLCCLWPSSYFLLPERLARSEWIAGRPGTCSPSFCCLSLLCSPGNTTGDGGCEGLQPPAPLPMLGLKEASFILEASRVEERSFSPLLPLPPPAVSQSTKISQIVLAGIYKKAPFEFINRVSR